jgi:hypothetical protein
MNRNTKALLWIVAVFAVMAVGLYIGGCGDDETTTDAGTVTDPCEGKKGGDPCTGGFCVDKVGGGLECAKECTIVGIDESCGEGNGCYKLGSNKVCLKGGTKKPGEACGVANDCEVGSICLDNEGLKCWQVCSKKEDCSAGDCVDTELGFNVCVAE